MRLIYFYMYLPSLASASQLITFPFQCSNSFFHLSAIFSCSPEGHEQVLSLAYESTQEGNTLHANNAIPQLSSPAEKAPIITGRPWNVPPICTQPMEGIGESLCVYTSTTFASGRGISIIARPSIAHQIFTSAAFTDRSIPGEVINQDPGQGQMQYLSGRGTGLLASKFLEIGDKVMVHTPALIYTRLMGNLLDAPDREYLFNRAVEQLPPNTRNVVLNLARSFDQDEVKIQDIVHTNAFQIEFDGETHSALWPEASRMNHDCGPNAQYYINTSTLTHHVQAVRHISPGDEISISYFFPMLPRDERRGHLHAGYHFNCTCARCMNPQSDSRVNEIAAIEAALNDWSPDSITTQQRNGPYMSRKLIKLYETEGLESLSVRPYGLAAQENSALRDAKNARKYAKKAVQYGVLTFGEFADDVEAMKLLERDAKSHWSWGKRSQYDGIS